MPSPLYPFRNARLLLESPGTRGGPETGYQRQPGQQVVLELWLKQASPGARSQFQQLAAASVATDLLQGYVVAFSDVPAGADWRTLVPADSPNYDDSGKRPPALRKGARPAAVLFGTRETEAIEVIESAGTFDDLGIGATVRNVIGDRIVLSAEWRQ
ncbi:MAG: hypothetical protein ACPGSE_00500 [Synechococcus sp.]